MRDHVRWPSGESKIHHQHLLSNTDSHAEVSCFLEKCSVTDSRCRELYCFLEHFSRQWESLCLRMLNLFAKGSDAHPVIQYFYQVFI